MEETNAEHCPLIISHDLKVERCFIWWECWGLWAQETASQELWENCSEEAGGTPGYIQVCDKGSRQSEHWRSDTNLENLAFYMWEGASLWAHWIHSFHKPRSYLGPHLFPSSPYGVGDVAEGCFLHSPSSSAITEGVDSVCWIEVLGAPIPVWDFPCSLVGKEFACNVRDPGLIPGLGGSPERGNGSPLQYSSLENPMDRGAWWATVHGVKPPMAVTFLVYWYGRRYFHFHNVKS